MTRPWRFLPCPTPCCEPGACASASDSFNRADSPSIGSAWTVASGSAEIDTDAAKLAAGTVALFDDFHPTGGWAVVRVDIDVLRAMKGQEYRAIAGYKDSTNYYFAFVKLNNTDVPPLFTFGIGKGTGAGESILISIDDTVSTTAAAIILCFGKSMIQAFFESYGLCTYIDPGVENPEGWKTGIGSGPSAAIYVDSWSAEEHFDSGKEDCPSCWCLCTKTNGHLRAVPKTLNMAVTITGNPLCQCLAKDVGLVIVQIPPIPVAGAPCASWKGPYSGACVHDETCPGPEGGVPYDCDIVLECGGDFSDNYGLSIRDKISGVTFGSASPDVFTCDPFYLEFRIAAIDWPVSGCGCYTIQGHDIIVIVTE